MNNEANETAKKFLVQGKTKLVKGSILTPEMSGLRMIMVAAPETGLPNDDLYNLLDKKWKNAKAELKGWHQHHVDFKLGHLRETAVNSDIWIVHCLFTKKDGSVDSKALETCLKKLCERAKYEKASVHVSTLLTSSVPELEKLLTEALVEKGVSVLFYEETKK